MAFYFPLILTLLSTFSFIVLGITQFAFSGPSQLHKRFFSLFLFAIALSQLNYLIMISGVVKTVPSLAYVGNTLGLSFVLFLYFYVKSVTDRTFKVRRKDWLHSIPFIGIFAVVFCFYHALPHEKKLAILMHEVNGGFLFGVLLPIVIFVILLYYLVMTLNVVFKFQSTLKDNLSEIEPYEMSWLIVSIAGGACLWGLEVLVYSMNVLLPALVPQYLYINFIALGSFSLAIYFLVSALKTNKRTPIDLTDIASDKYGQHRLDDKNLEELSEHLMRYCDQHKPYLKADLTLSDLSQKLPMTARELSQVINRYHNCSFFDFINDLRIKYAVFTMKEQADKSLSEIMFSCGFSSKSAFYSAFKKKMKMTPGQFRHFNASGDNTPS